MVEIPLAKQRHSKVKKLVSQIKGDHVKLPSCILSEQSKEQQQDHPVQ